MEDFLMGLLSPRLIWVFIPITWLILATIDGVIKSFHKHRERMALIRQGIHPDFPEFEDASPTDASPDQDRLQARDTADYIPS